MGFRDGSGISWTINKQSAPRSRQITTPAPHHSSVNTPATFWYVVEFILDWHWFCWLLFTTANARVRAQKELYKWTSSEIGG